MKKSAKDALTQLREYVAFLQKRVQSKNYKTNVSAEEFAETKAKYDKAKLKLRILEMK